MSKELPKFKDELEESAWFDDPKNVEEFFKDGEEVKLDFGPLREKIRKQRAIDAAKQRKRAAG